MCGIVTEEKGADRIGRKARGQKQTRDERLLISSDCLREERRVEGEGGRRELRSNT